MQRVCAGISRGAARRRRVKSARLTQLCEREGCLAQYTLGTIARSRRPPSFADATVGLLVPFSPGETLPLPLAPATADPFAGAPLISAIWASSRLASVENLLARLARSEAL